MDYASLNGTQRITKGVVSIPYYGRWVADVTLAQAADLATGATLVVGNLSLVGAVYRSATFAGARAALLVAGAGKWNTVVGRASYQLDSGVMLSLVLGDVAREIGETISLATDMSIGTSFTRRAAPAVNVLRQLAGALWWIDEAGVTQIGPRPAGTITSQFTLEALSGSKGRYSVATDLPGDWMPGKSFQAPTMVGIKTIAHVQHNIENNGKVRTEVLAA